MNETYHSDVSFFKEHVCLGHIQIQKVANDKQIVDYMTKDWRNND